MVPESDQYGNEETVLADTLSNPRRRSIHREQIRDCHVVLYHDHLPKLADAGVVEFDTDRRIVSVTEAAPSHPMDSPTNDSIPHR